MQINIYKLEDAVYKEHARCTFGSLNLIVSFIIELGEMTMSDLITSEPRLLKPYARGFMECIKILFLIHESKHPTLTLLSIETAYSEEKIRAVFKRLHEQYNLIIQHVDRNGNGYYKVADWGVLDQKTVLSLQGN